MADVAKLTELEVEAGLEDSSFLNEEDNTTAAPPSSNAASGDKAEQDDKGEKEESFLDRDPEPCKNFRIDVTKSFGHCKCGWPRSAHEEKGESKAAQALKELKAKNSAEAAATKSDGPCKNFRADTTATEFGVCKNCGYKQIDHVEKGANKAAEALRKLKSTKSDAGPVKTGKPCNNYKVDTAASEFGVCLCGFKKEDHIEKEENVAAKLLKGLKEKNAAKNAKEDLIAAGVKPEEGESKPELEASGGTGTATTANNGKGSCCVIS